MSDIIKIKGARLVYPSIYEPFKNPNFELRYATVFEYDGKKLEKAGMRKRDKDRLYTTNSKYSPVINSRDNKSDYETLLRAYRIARARNLSMNTIFRDVNADLELHLFDWQYGKSASIMKIWVDEQDVLKSAVLSH